MALKHALLGLLSNGPASGYDLLKEFAGSLYEVWPATQSQVYTELTKLSEDGLVTIETHGARGRKEYSVTADGLAELRTWMIETAPVYVRRSDMLLRVFFLNTIEPKEARNFLAKVAETAAGEETTLQAVLAGPSSGDQPLARNGRLALEYGIRLARLQQEWAQWAAEQTEHD